jgi:hypothetical protein
MGPSATGTPAHARRGEPGTGRIRDPAPTTPPVFPALTRHDHHRDVTPRWLLPPQRRIAVVPADCREHHEHHQPRIPILTLILGPSKEYLVVMRGLPAGAGAA